MEKKALWILILTSIVVAGCVDPQGVIGRANSDYFPLTLTSSWRYISENGGDTVALAVADYYEVGNDTVFVLDFIGDIWELLLQNGDILRHYRYNIYPSGDEVTLEDNYGSFIEFPFVDGNSWRYFYADTVEFRGVDYSYRHVVAGRCELIGDFDVPYGDFDDVYMVTIADTVVTDTISVASTELYFARDTGPIAIRYNGELYKLVDYTNGE